MRIMTERRAISIQPGVEEWLLMAGTMTI